MYVYRILFSNDPQQISINSAKKNGLENDTETWILAKNAEWRKRILKFCYIYLS